MIDMKTPQRNKEIVFWYVLIGFAITALEMSSYFSTGHLVFFLILIAYFNVAIAMRSRRLVAASAGGNV